MEFYLIRHTKVAVKQGVCYGQTDVDLSDTYLEELKSVKKNLGGIEFDAIYTSPLKRAKQLAKDVFPDQKIIEDVRLMELNFGDWEGKEWTDIKDPDFAKWMKDFVNLKCTNGESFIMLRDRVSNFWEELKLKSHKRIAIFTHAGVMRTVLAIKNKMKLEDSFREATPEFGELIKIEV